MAILIKTNNQPRELLSGFDVADIKGVRADNDYLTDEEFDAAMFVKYKDEIYNLDQFMRISLGSDDELSSWDGYMPFSYSAGLVIRFTEYCDAAIVGYYVGG